MSKDEQAPASVFSRYDRALLPAIMLLGAALRIYGLAARSMWYDEGYTIAFSKMLGINTAFLDTSITSDAPILPAMVRAMAEFLERVPLAAPGSHAYDVFLRSIPCAFSILTIYLCYRLVLLLFGDKHFALAAAFLCAISPFQVYYAQELKPYSLLLTVSLFAYIFLIRATDKNKPFDWLALAFSLGVGMYVHLFAVWNILLANAYFAVTIRRRTQMIPQWIATQFVTAAIALPMALFAFQWTHIYESIQNVWAVRPDYATPFITFKTFFAGYGATSWSYWLLFALTFSLFVCGLYAMRRSPDRLLMALIFTALPIVANVIIWRHRHFPFYEHRVFIAASAFAYAAVAVALLNLPRSWMRYSAWALIVATSIVGLRDYYVQNLHPMQTHRLGVRYKVANREAAAYIADRFETGDAVGHASHFTYFPFLHYLPGIRQCNLRTSEEELTGFLQAIPNKGAWNTYGALPVMMEDAAQNASRMWLVESWWEPAEFPPHFDNMKLWLDRRYNVSERASFDGIRVTLYSRKGQQP